MPRAALVAATAAAAVLLGAPVAPAAQVTGDCDLTFNGVAAERITTLSSPLELNDQDVLRLRGTDLTAPAAVRLELIAGPVTVQSTRRTGSESTTAVEADLDLSSVAAYGVGLYQARATTNSCEARVWVRISGRFPLATLAGILAGAFVLVGLAVQLTSIATRTPGGVVGAALAGIPTGVGAAIIGQQFGRLQLSYPSVAIIVGIAALLGAVLAYWVWRRGRRRIARRAAATTTGASSAANGDLLVSETATSSSAAVADAGLPVADMHDRPEPPFWAYVMGPVDMFDLRDHTRVVAVLRPGTWYLVKRVRSQWTLVDAAGVEGWVPSAAINPHETANP